MLAVAVVVLWMLHFSFLPIVSLGLLLWLSDPNSERMLQFYPRLLLVPNTKFPAQ